MPKHRTEFSIVRGAVIVAIVLIVGGAVARVWYGQHHRLSSNSGLLIEIDDSGSTNTRAWVLDVNKDGSGEVTNAGSKSQEAYGKVFKKGTFNVGPLTQSLQKFDIHHLPTCANPAAPVTTSLSVSFGSTATFVYKGVHITQFCENNEFCTGSSVECDISNELYDIIETANLS